MRTSLYTLRTGSHLFGTSTPTSDVDYKTVYLPALGELLLGGGVKNSAQSTKEGKGKNTSTDVDHEYVPLQVFARDFLNGQTYALELAFAVDAVAERDAEDELVLDVFRSLVHQLRSRFLTSNVKAMVGYAANQASLYSFKGERLSVVAAVQGVLESLGPSDAKLSSVAEVPGFTAALLKFPKYFQLTTYDVGRNDFRPCFKLLEKTLPFTNTVGHSLEVVQNLRAKYGERVKTAAESPEQVDWKATAHAVRVTYEALELLTTSKLTLPRPDAELLKQVRRGEVTLTAVQELLDFGLDAVKTAQLSCQLPALTPELSVEFDAWLTAELYNLYNLNP